MLLLIQSALLIFVLRVVDVSLYTLRMKMVMSGRKSLAWIAAFLQSIVYVTAIRAVLTGMDNWLNVIGYASGFATGNVIGMLIEERLAIGYTHLRIISARYGPEIAEKLRFHRYGVTEIPARGKNGMVSYISCSVQRKDAQKLIEIVDHIDPEAFITAEAMRQVRRGYWGR